MFSKFIFLHVYKQEKIMKLAKIELESNTKLFNTLSHTMHVTFTKF